MSAGLLWLSEVLAALRRPRLGRGAASLPSPPHSGARWGPWPGDLVDALRRAMTDDLASRRSETSLVDRRERRDKVEYVGSHPSAGLAGQHKRITRIVKERPRAG